MNIVDTVNAALSLHKSGEIEKAKSIYLSVIELDKSNFDALHLLACVFHSEKNYEKSECYFFEAMKLCENSPLLYNNLGNMYFASGDFVKAIESYRKSIFLDEKNPSAHNNLGVVLKEQSNFSEAMECFNRAIKIDWEYGDAHWNRSILNLLLRNYKDGWIEFEWRWNSPYVSKISGFKQYSKPTYNGTQPLQNATLLVYSEQGLGDSIQFFRFVLEIKKKCKNLIFQCQSQLVGLFSSADKSISVVSHDFVIESLHFDYVVPLLSLPLVMGYIENTTFPYKNGYISPTDFYKSKWKSYVNENHACLNVGLAWSGNPGHSNDRFRSIPSEYILELSIYFPQINFYVLQKDISKKDKNILNSSNIIFSNTQIINFEDTVGLSHNLDHIISVDTSVLHIAGASGCGTTLILPKVPDWRWLLDTTKTEWYSSVEILRCNTNGNWSNVISSIKIKLNNILANKNV